MTNTFVKIAGGVSVAAAVMLMAGCKKVGGEDVTPPEQVHFLNQSINTYYVQNSPTSVYNIGVGATTPSSVDRTVNYTVTSPTGAVAGTQYTIVNSGTVVIPAGQVIGQIQVKGIFAGFPGNRIDTLIFRITSSNPKSSDYNSETRLVMKKYCDVNIPALTGNYNNTFDFSGSPSPDYGPYSVNVVPVTPGVYGTKDTLRINNFWDYGNPVDVIIDWTDPANFKTTVIDGAYVYTDPTYGVARIKARGNGSFSSCDQKFTINFSIYVAAGTFTNPFSSVLSR